MSPSAAGLHPTRRITNTATHRRLMVVLKVLLTLVAALLLVAPSARARDRLVYWERNGHFYELRESLQAPFDLFDQMPATDLTFGIQYTGHLYTPTSPLEDAFVRSQLLQNARNASDLFWAGARLKSGSWNYTDGAAESGIAIPRQCANDSSAMATAPLAAKPAFRYANWADSHPQDCNSSQYLQANAPELCLAVSVQGTWFSRDCSETRSVIIEYEPLQQLAPDRTQCASSHRLTTLGCVVDHPCSELAPCENAQSPTGETTAFCVEEPDALAVAQLEQDPYSCLPNALSGQNTASSFYVALALPPHALAIENADLHATDDCLNYVLSQLLLPVDRKIAMPPMPTPRTRYLNIASVSFTTTYEAYATQSFGHPTVTFMAQNQSSQPMFPAPTAAIGVIELEILTHHIVHANASSTNSTSDNAVFSEIALLFSAIRGWQEHSQPEPTSDTLSPLPADQQWYLVNLHGSSSTFHALPSFSLECAIPSGEGHDDDEGRGGLEPFQRALIIIFSILAIFALITLIFWVHRRKKKREHLEACSNLEYDTKFTGIYGDSIRSPPFANVKPLSSAFGMSDLTDDGHSNGVDETAPVAFTHAEEPDVAKMSTFRSQQHSAPVIHLQPLQPHEHDPMSSNPNRYSLSTDGTREYASIPDTVDRASYEKEEGGLRPLSRLDKLLGEASPRPVESIYGSVQAYSHVMDDGDGSTTTVNQGIDGAHAGLRENSRGSDAVGRAGERPFVSAKGASVGDLEESNDSFDQASHASEQFYAALPFIQQPRDGAADGRHDDGDRAGDRDFQEITSVNVDGSSSHQQEKQRQVGVDQSVSDGRSGSQPTTGLHSNVHHSARTSNAGHETQGRSFGNHGGLPTSDGLCDSHSQSDSEADFDTVSHATEEFYSVAAPFQVVRAPGIGRDAEVGGVHSDGRRVRGAAPHATRHTQSTTSIASSFSEADPDSAIQATTTQDESTSARTSVSSTGPQNRPQGVLKSHQSAANARTHGQSDGQGHGHPGSKVRAPKKWEQDRHGFGVGHSGGLLLNDETAVVVPLNSDALRSHTDPQLLLPSATSSHEFQSPTSMNTDLSQTSLRTKLAAVEFSPNSCSLGPSPLRDQEKHLSHADETSFSSSMDPLSSSPLQPHHVSTASLHPDFDALRAVQQQRQRTSSVQSRQALPLPAEAYCVGSPSSPPGSAVASPMLLRKSPPRSQTKLSCQSSPDAHLSARPLVAHSRAHSAEFTLPSDQDGGVYVTISDVGDAERRGASRAHEGQGFNEAKQFQDFEASSESDGPVEREYASIPDTDDDDDVHDHDVDNGAELTSPARTGRTRHPQPAKSRASSRVSTSPFNDSWRRDVSFNMYEDTTSDEEDQAAYDDGEHEWSAARVGQHDGYRGAGDGVDGNDDEAGRDSVSSTQSRSSPVYIPSFSSPIRRGSSQQDVPEDQSTFIPVVRSRSSLQNEKFMPGLSTISSISGLATISSGGSHADRLALSSSSSHNSPSALAMLASKLATSTGLPGNSLLHTASDAEKEKRSVNNDDEGETEDVYVQIGAGREDSVDRVEGAKSSFNGALGTPTLTHREESPKRPASSDGRRTVFSDPSRLIISPSRRAFALHAPPEMRPRTQSNPASMDSGQKGSGSNSTRANNSGVKRFGPGLRRVGSAQSAAPEVAVSHGSYGLGNGTGWNFPPQSSLMSGMERGYISGDDDGDDEEAVRSSGLRSNSAVHAPAVPQGGHGQLLTPMHRLPRRRASHSPRPSPLQISALNAKQSRSSEDLMSSDLMCILGELNKFADPKRKAHPLSVDQASSLSGAEERRAISARGRRRERGSNTPAEAAVGLKEGNGTVALRHHSVDAANRGSGFGSERPYSTIDLIQDSYVKLPYSRAHIYEDPEKYLRAMKRSKENQRRSLPPPASGLASYVHRFMSAKEAQSVLMASKPHDGFYIITQYSESSSPGRGDGHGVEAFSLRLDSDAPPLADASTDPARTSTTSPSRVGVNGKQPVMLWNIFVVFEKTCSRHVLKREGTHFSVDLHDLPDSVDTLSSALSLLHANHVHPLPCALRTCVPPTESDA